MRPRIWVRAAVALVFTVAALLFASSAGAATVPTTGLVMVHVSSPHAPRNVFLRTKDSVAAFVGKLHADHIALHLPATGPGSCTGGTTYSAELTYKTGHKQLLYAIECKGALSGNLSGNVKAFVEYLETLVG